jgi:biopolymer transport protein TolQ
MSPTEASVPLANKAAAAAPHALNPLDLMLGSSGIVLVVLLLLILASTFVWVIWVAKSLQLSRLRSTHRAFEKAAVACGTGAELVALADRSKGAPGARVVLALNRRLADPALTQDLLTAVARRAQATEEQRAGSLMPSLSSIASASPFVGLFGTVWGIMDAFLKIGMEKSASLPVVAPAIGEALIATAFGLVAAIPATVAYNFVDRKIADLSEELSASADIWVALLYADEMQERARTGMHAVRRGA